MKIKKKLSLNKITVTDLNGKEMQRAIGGVSGPDTTCLETKLITCGVASCGSFCLTLPDIICKNCW
jgi:hypothetical protein